MQKKYCLKPVKNIFIFLGIILPTFLLISAKESYALSTNTINLQGKIVRNDTGYEGLNVSTGNPACVVAGSANDTCDFRVRYYSASSGGTLFLTEEFSNQEIGQYNGAFNLSLGSDPSPTAGSYSSLDALIAAEDTVYVEMGFDPAGGNSYTETFTRMPLQATAFAMRSKYASHASTAFQFDTAADSSGYSSPSAGMVYFDTTDTALKVYDGASWVEIGSGGTGSSLWTQGSGFAYLTTLTDHLVLGADSYTAIGTDNYATYAAGLGTRAPMSFDMGAERLTLSGDQSKSGLTVYSHYSSTSAWPVVLFKAESSSFDNLVLEIVQDGTGHLMSMKKGSTEVFAFENPMTFYMRPRDDAPTTYENRLYNVNGALYWNGSTVAMGWGSLWTDAGTYTYLTDDDDDVIIGGTSSLDSVFYFDVANGRLGIGTGTPSSRLDIAGASSVISNSTGDLTISAEESVVIKALNADPDNLMEWQNSSGTILSLINQSGYASFGKSTGSTSAILSLGANTTSVAQLNFASSVGTDVSSPNTGDLWWNGTNLYFYDGSQNVDLIGSSGGVGFYTGFGSVNHESYLNVLHSDDTYNVVADGWVCIGGSSNESCSGGNWKNIKDMDTTIGHYFSNVWDKADEDGMIRTRTRLSNVELTPTIRLGTGEDGALSLSTAGDANINTEDLLGRGCSGDAIHYSVTALTEYTATVAVAPTSACLTDGDEILLINLQGTQGSTLNVGNYETLRVSDVTGSTVTFETAKSKYYGDGATDDTNLGTGANNQKVMLQRVPNYSSVTIGSSVNLVPSEYDYTTGLGGVVFFRVSGTLSVAGSIDASGLGYIAGTAASTYDGGVATPGHSIFYTTGTDGRGGTTTTGNENGIAGTFSGGGGAGRVGTGGALGVGGSGSTSFGAGGGGGGGTVNRYNSTGDGGNGGGGGGGGYGTPGGGGDGYTTATSGSSSSSGAGSDAGRSGNNRGGGGGGGSSNFGATVATLDRLFLGSGGGGGGAGRSSGGVDYSGNNGGKGAGIIFISAETVSVSGSIRANGVNGVSSSSSQGGGGGGGSGGSVRIGANQASIGTSLVSATGGTGGAGSATYVGGNGGDGRIAIYYSESYTGTTANATVTEYYESGYNSYGVYNSPVIPTLNAQSYAYIMWEEYLDTYGKISIQTRSGNSTDPTDGTWEAWKPSTSTTNYTVLESMDTHTNWTGTNATVAEGDVTRNVDYFEDEDEATAGNITKITSSTNGGYAEATISSTDISGYDYITFWVRASQIGNTLRFSFGESAGDEEFENITIDTSNTWQKVYWDISDITSTDMDAVTKLRLTNFSTSSNTIYLDNIKVETLLSDRRGGPITSTPDDYLQYRIIFTTTHLSYQPRLENIVFSFSGGYRIIVHDNNNVRLYNYTGATEYLKLTVVTQPGGSGADLAELYPSKQNLRPGEIVSMDTVNGGYIRRSEISYDPNVLGVISTNPGIVLGTGERYGDRTYELALSGRVPVLIDPLSEDIRIGDPITSSSLKGYGKKAVQSGSIVGYALGNWSKGSGQETVMIFISTERYRKDDSKLDNQVLAVSNEGLFFGFNLYKDSRLYASNSREVLLLDSTGTLYTTDTLTKRRSTVILINNTPLSLSEGDLVKFDTNSENGFTLASSFNEEGVYAVLKGVHRDGDKNKDGVCDPGDSCILYFNGLADVNVGTGNEVSKGDYIYSSSEEGRAEASSQEYENANRIGVVLSDTTKDEGYVRMLFNGKNKEFIDRYIGIGVNRDFYTQLYTQKAFEYEEMSIPERRGMIETGNGSGMYFDNLFDELKIDLEKSDMGGEGAFGHWTYHSGVFSFDGENNGATMWLKSEYSLDESQIKTFASNDEGKTYVEGFLVKTYEDGGENDYEFGFDFSPAFGSSYVVRVEYMGRDDVIDRWIFVPHDSGYGKLDGYLEVEKDSIGSQESVEVVHNQDTYDFVARGWYFNQQDAVWEYVGESNFMFDIPDTNTVRLVNKTDKVEKVKLMVMFNPSLDNFSYVSVAPSLSQKDYLSNSDSIWVDKLYDNGNLMKLQTQGEDRFVVGSEGNLSMAGDIEVGGGSIKLGSNGWIRFNNSTNMIEFTNDGNDWIALGPLFTSMILSAEYPGAVFSADGTDNNGSMIADSDVSNNSMNYYQWNSSQSSLNDYDIRVRFTLPPNFDNWGTGGIMFNYATESQSISANKIDFYIFKENSNTVDGLSENRVSPISGEWSSTTIPGSSLKECVSAGDTCMLIIKMSSSNDNYVRVGDIQIGYSRKL